MLRENSGAEEAGGVCRLYAYLVVTGIPGRGEAMALKLAEEGKEEEEDEEEKQEDKLQ